MPVDEFPVAVNAPVDVGDPEGHVAPRAAVDADMAALEAGRVGEISAGGDDKVLPDGSPPPSAADPVTDYQPCARPGHRAPHLWLDSSRTVSTLDLFTGKFILLTSARGNWHPAVTAASDSGIPVQLTELRPPAWAESYGVEPAGAVLVRPDGYVAARWPSAPPSARSAVADVLATILSPCLLYTSPSPRD